MDEKQKREQLNRYDLSQFKELIGDAERSDLSLEAILAEFGGNPEPPRPAPEPDGDKVVAFPGPALPLEPEEDTPSEEEPPPEESSAPEDEGEPEGEAGPEIIPFPGARRDPLRSLLRGIGRRADDYADRMFEEDERTDRKEVRRLEKLIPGTDKEEPPPEPPKPPRPRRVEPPPPDLSPRELAQTWGRGLTWLRTRSLLVLALFCAALVQLLCPALGFIWLPPLDSPAVQSWTAVGLLAAGVLLSYDVLFESLVRAFRLKLGMDTLALLACLFTLADGTFLALSADPGRRLPYSAVSLLQLFCLLHGAWHKRCALRLSCRTAAASSSPYRVTLDENKWNGKDTYCKWSGDAERFGSQIQTDDGAQRIFRVACPLLLAGVFLLTLLSCRQNRGADHLLWTLSALFTASSALGSALVYGRAFHGAARRLARSGGALAGWPGIAGSRRDSRVLVTDADLFPTGHVELLRNYRISRDFPQERVMAYTATLLRDAGSGISKPFLDELRRMGGLTRHAERLCFYEGGLSANIRGDRVLVGSAAFMKLMEIPVSQGLNVRNAVFCAVNGSLAGIFALDYNLPDIVFPALEELLREKVGPVLATRDFNLIPAMLRQRFKLAADRMDFPPVERRRELSDPNQPHSQTLSALLCREGLLPFAEAITAARRLRRATCLGAALCCAGSALGLLLCAFLTSLSAYSSLSPLNLLIYMLTWLAPVWFLSSWAARY